MWCVAFIHTFAVSEYNVKTREEAYRKAIQDIYEMFPNGIVGRDKATGVTREYSPEEMIEEIWEDTLESWEEES